MKVADFWGVRVEKYFVRWYIIILWSGVRQNSRFCKCNAAKPLRFGKGPAHKVCGNTQSAALLPKFKPPVWRLFCFLFVLLPGSRGVRRDDIENTARMGGGDYRVFCFSLLNADKISVAL